MKRSSLLTLVATLLLAAVLAAVLAGCGGNQGSSGNGSGSAGTNGSTGADSASKKASYQKASPQKAQQMMAESTDFIILDVRTESEYLEKHLIGATLLPVDEVASRAPGELPDKDQLIFVYCRSGGRSASAAQTLVGLGYTNVYDLGGINSWPYETTSG